MSHPTVRRIVELPLVNTDDIPACTALPAISRDEKGLYDPLIIATNQNLDGNLINEITENYQLF